jgi:cytochrome c peroxidase
MKRSASSSIVLALFVAGCGSPSTASKASIASVASPDAGRAALETGPSPRGGRDKPSDSGADVATDAETSDAPIGDEGDAGPSLDATAGDSAPVVADSGSISLDGGACGLMADGGLALAPAAFMPGHAIDTTFCDGRSCTTCHVPDRAFTIGPADVEARYQANPNDPLFRDVDRDPDGTFTTLRTYALFNVIITLPDNVSDVNNPSARTITVRRAAPSLFNLYLNPGPFLADGRAATLEAQIPGAVQNHFETAAPLLPGFVSDAAQYERSIFSDPILAASVSSVPANSASVYSIPLANPSALVVQGRTVFKNDCESACHSDPESNDLGRGLQAGLSAKVSEVNANGLPVLELMIANVVYQTSDPGIFSAYPSHVNSFFAPQLRGISQTAPYFHDHSAPTLDAVLDHYQSTGIIQTLSAADRQALLAYLNAL